MHLLASIILKQIYNLDLIQKNVKLYSIVYQLKKSEKMTTTLNPNTTNIYSTQDDKKYSGVVKVSSNGYYGTGALLYDGMAILTAAHLFTDANQQAEVTFDLPSGTQTISSSSIKIISTYDTLNSNDDLAIVWLSQRAPSQAQRYEIYRDSDEIGQTFAFLGYGKMGTGSIGDAIENNTQRLVSTNKFESQGDTLKEALGGYMAWNPSSDVLVADFDDATSQHDAFGELMGIHDLGSGDTEGILAAGDSGGSAFLDGKIAGVSSYGASLHTQSGNPDIDSEINSTFGELGFWQRVSSYQEFIDKSLRANYKNQTMQKSEVVKKITEADAGEITFNYFLLELSGIREDGQVSSVEYTTRDGSATAGEDYLAVSGRINVYSDENSVLIPVEILGDNTVENDETFYLDIFNPIGGIFENNEIILTAQRTIVDDDFY